MDLYQIRYFLTIADVGNFTKAAEQLFVSQPSLSAGIKKLEKELDATLFERGGRTVLLTPAGHLFQERARAIVAEYQSVRQDLQQLKDKPTLRIATLHSIRGNSIAELISKFHKQYPSVFIELCNGCLPDLQNWLEQGKVDLALTWLREQDDDQNSQFLFHQPLALAVPSNHTFAQIKSACLADLNEQPYIKRLNCEFWQLYPKLFDQAGVMPHMVYASNNEEWVISLIQAGVGMSIMPVWDDLTHITYILMTDLSLSRTIGLQWRRQQNLDVVNWFRSFVVEQDWKVACSSADFMQASTL